jgi:hypothetical protein
MVKARDPDAENSFFVTQRVHVRARLLFSSERRVAPRAVIM